MTNKKEMSSSTSSQKYNGGRRRFFGFFFLNLEGADPLGGSLDRAWVNASAYPCFVTICA